MSHLRLVSNTPAPAPAGVPYDWEKGTPLVDDLPPPLPREAVATAKVDDIFGDLFTPRKRPESKEVTISRGTPKTPTIDEIEGLLPPAVLARMKEAMKPTAPVEPALPPLPREAAQIDYQYQRRPVNPRRRNRTNEPRVIAARFPSRCHETGNEINTGDSILWYPLSKEVYCEDSQHYRENV